MSKAGKPLISFNVKNGVYSTDGIAIKPLNFLTALSREKSQTTKDIYGDGELQLSINNDQGYTGTLTMTAADPDYNKDLGMTMELVGGSVANVTQHKSIRHYIGLESYDMITLPDGSTFEKVTGKIWICGVTASAPSETLNQNTTDFNENNVDYPLAINGVDLKNTAGDAIYVDANGLTYKAFSAKSLPGAADYADFLLKPPVPKKIAV